MAACGRERDSNRRPHGSSRIQPRRDAENNNRKKEKKNKQDEYHTMHKLMHTSELHAVQKIQAIYIDIYICVYINMYIYI